MLELSSSISYRIIRIVEILYEFIFESNFFRILYTQEINKLIKKIREKKIFVFIWHCTIYIYICTVCNYCYFVYWGRLKISNDPKVLFNCSFLLHRWIKILFCLLCLNNDEWLWVIALLSKAFNKRIGIHR